MKTTMKNEYVEDDGGDHDEDNDYLLTECEIWTGKNLPEIFVQLCAEKIESKYFPVQTEQTRLIRNLLYGF